MAKQHTFIRIKSSNKQVICINPHLIASFQIEEKAKIKTKNGEIVANTIRLYTAVGTTFSYSVGIDITEQEFAYICSTLIEFLYLNEVELKAKAEAKLEEWNKIMTAESEEEKALTTPKA